jgi:hypothetical protein
VRIVIVCRGVGVGDTDELGVLNNEEVVEKEENIVVV